MPGPPAPSPAAHDRRLVSAIWPLLVVMTLMLTLSLLSVLVVSAGKTSLERSHRVR